MFSVAKQRLPDTIRDHRAKGESSKAFTNGKMTVDDAATVYLGVEAQQVIHVEVESGDGSFEIEGVMRAMPVVVVEEGMEPL